jgi:hypothetical protein
MKMDHNLYFENSCNPKKWLLDEGFLIGWLGSIIIPPDTENDMLTNITLSVLRWLAKQRRGVFS